jgi:hypothetical protein
VTRELLGRKLSVKEISNADKSSAFFAKECFIVCDVGLDVVEGFETFSAALSGPMVARVRLSWLYAAISREI